MAKPPYIQAFEHFKANTNDPLIAYVAFGLYVETEHQWASGLAHWPNQNQCRNYYQHILPHNGHDYTDKADDALVNFANNVVAAERHTFLRAEERGFWYGVLQGVVAAIIYSAFLLGGSYIAVRQGVDIFEAFRRAYTEHQSEQPALHSAEAPTSAAAPLPPVPKQ